MSAESLERPGLVGPRNETAEEVAGPSRVITHEGIDRPLWRASDGKMTDPPRESNDDEDVGPLGEPRDDEDVGPLGESRDEEELDSLEESSDEDEVYHFEELSDEDQDGLPQALEEEGEVASPGNLDELLQLAATSVSMMSGVPTNTGEASSSRATTTLSTEPQESLISSPPPLASTLATPSSKRTRNSEDDAQDEESSPQQKRMRMDDILGIVRKDVQSAEVLQSVEPGMTSDRQRCTKRARSLGDDSEDIVTKPASKRARLLLPVNECRHEEEESFTADQGDIIEDGESSLVHQEARSNEVIEEALVIGNPTNAGAYQPSVVEEQTIDSETEESEDGFADDEASSTETEWDTAHGINSTYANIVFSDKGIYDVTGALRHFRLPTSTGSPDRAWTEEEKENLRVYIQDYGIQDWALLAQSTNRPERELQSMYLEVITARNKQAGRPDRAGITPAYPDLTPPPPPVFPKSPKLEEPRKLRSHSKRGRPNKNRLGDLTYDLKATTFPRVTRDGGMVDAKGNPLYGVMGDISYATKRRQPKPKQEDHVSLPPADGCGNNVPDESEEEESDSEIEEGQTFEPAELDRELAPSPEAVSKGKAPLYMNVEEEEDPEINQEEDSDQEWESSVRTAPEAKTDSHKHVLGPKFAGICKLSGSSRRGVPRKAARLRKWSAV